MFVYVLECVGGKFYIGRTERPEIRLDQHHTGRGAEWTRLHPPIRVIEMIPKCVPEDEDKFVKIWMRKKGIERVRGGTYSQITLPSDVIRLLQKEIWGAENACFRCGSKDHFVRACPEKESSSTETEDAIVCQLKELRNAGLSMFAGNNQIKVKRIVREETTTRIDTDAQTVTKVREMMSRDRLLINGQPYRIITTKRDCGLWNPTNYIVLEGTCPELAEGNLFLS